MIYNTTKLKVCDNSGIKIAKCFKIYKNSVGTIGDLIAASVKNMKTKNKLKKGDIVKGLLVRRRKSINRNTGSYISFDENEIIILNEKYEPTSTRLFGPIPMELRKKGNLKFLSLASVLI